jgi:hypothetical protein
MFNQPHSIALDGAGAVYVADIGNHRIRRIDPNTGIVNSIAGNSERKLPQDGQIARRNPILGPRALFIDGDTMWIALREGHSVWRMDLRDGILHHAAGSGKAGYAGDGGPAVNAQFNGPKGIAVGPDENVYIADTENHAIRKIDQQTGTITTVAGGNNKTTPHLDRPHGICVGPDGAIYIGDTLNHLVRRASASGSGENDAADASAVKIKGLRRLDDTIARLGGTGDNWHMTWAADDRVLAGLCDGDAQPWHNLPRRPYNARLIAINGTPPQLEFHDTPGYPDLLSESDRRSNRYYGFGLLAVDGHIYQFLSTPNRPFNEPQPRFVGAKLIHSPDNGKTWHNQDGSTPVRWENWDERSNRNMAFFEEPGDAFSLLTILQMGKDYEQNEDGYLYVYAPNGNAEGTMNQLVMFRVPKNRVLDRSAYEYFVARRPDGTATWSNNIAERGVVHTFPSGWVNTKIHPYSWHPSIVYNQPLRLYMMANWGMGFASDGMWFGKPSYFGFWTAPQPWGPWTQIHEETHWMPGGDSGARAYQPQIAPKWIAPDGKSFWLVWTDFQDINGRKPYYSFNTQKVELLAE